MVASRSDALLKSIINPPGYLIIHIMIHFILKNCQLAVFLHLFDISAVNLKRYLVKMHR